MENETVNVFKRVGRCVTRFVYYLRDNYSIRFRRIEAPVLVYGADTNGCEAVYKVVVRNGNATLRRCKTKTVFLVYPVVRDIIRAIFMGVLLLGVLMAAQGVVSLDEFVRIIFQAQEATPVFEQLASSFWSVYWHFVCIVGFLRCALTNIFPSFSFGYLDYEFDEIQDKED